MFKVIYKYSACIKIQTDEVTILCDPWFSDQAYDGTWTQFPEIKNIENFIGDFDILYISHIHPDHYDRDTIKKLFKKFGEKEILIADWAEGKQNYLQKKIISDGFNHLINVSNKKTFNDFEINIIPNETGSMSDIDSAIIVSSKKLKKSVLNINDCIYNKIHFEKILNLKNKLNTEISLFCLGYTGAGPYPQTFYSPIIEQDILIKKATEKKNNFFERYKKAIQEIPSAKRLPFAGKYLLSGELSILNQFRGVADALEVKEFDDDAIVLDDSGNSFFDLEEMNSSNERSEFYRYPINQFNNRDYLWRTILNFNPSKVLLKRLLFQSIKRAHLKSECDENFFYSFYIYDNFEELKKIWLIKEPQNSYQPIITFNCNKNTNPFETNSEPKIHSHLFIESKALFAVLTGLTHWNNYDVGSVYQIRRKPDIYESNMVTYLNFLSVI